LTTNLFFPDSLIIFAVFFFGNLEKTNYFLIILKIETLNKNILPKKFWLSQYLLWDLLKFVRRGSRVREIIVRTVWMNFFSVSVPFRNYQSIHYFIGLLLGICWGTVSFHTVYELIVFGLIGNVARNPFIN
jgi:hypothetical protein